MVDICGKFPLATVNMACGQMATMTVPGNVDDPSQTVNDCDYQAGGSAALGKIWRGCTKDGTGPAYYNGARTDTLKPGEVRTDITGLGDKAFWAVEPEATNNFVTLWMLRGQTVSYIQCQGVPAAQVDTVKAAVLPLGQTLVAK